MISARMKLVVRVPGAIIYIVKADSQTTKFNFLPKLIILKPYYYGTTCMYMYMAMVIHVHESVPIMNVAVSDGLGFDLPRAGHLATR